MKYHEAMQLINDSIEIIEQSKLGLKLCHDLLDPEIYGHAVTAEVRNRAREVLGIEGKE